jgi:hypothetical protein
MHPLRALVAVVPWLLAACNVGLEPNRLERLHYGIDAERVAELLEVEILPQLRFFVPNASGGHHECRIDSCRVVHPHPLYWFLHVDGRLASVQFGAEPWFWHDETAAPTLQFPKLRTPAAMHLLHEQALSTRLPLAWSELQPLDAERPRRGPSPAGAAAESIVLGLPGLPLLAIYWLGREAVWALDGATHRRHDDLLRYFDTVPPGTLLAERSRRAGHRLEPAAHVHVRHGLGPALRRRLRRAAAVLHRAPALTAGRRNPRHARATFRMNLPWPC